MNTATRLFIAAACTALVTSCGQDNLTRVGRPPVVQGFSPTERSLHAFLGDTLQFAVRAFDPDESGIDQYFTLNDSIVRGGTTWGYVVDDTGRAEVTHTITDGTYSSRIQWEISRMMPINFPPRITSYAPLEAFPSAIIGTSIQFAVEATDPDREPLEYAFTVNDTVVSSEPNFFYDAKIIGFHRVRAIVSDGEYVATKDWRLEVTGVPDTIAPAIVPIDLVETGAEPGEVDLVWTAVGKDGMEGTASEYLVRTSPAPIISQFEWDRASDRPGVPAPVPAGGMVSMTINDLIPARLTYVSVRAVDDFGNLSPLSASPSVYTRGMHVMGTLTNALTGDPVVGQDITLGPYSVITQPDGRFDFFEMPPLISQLVIRDEDDIENIGDFFNYARGYQVQHLDDVDLYMIPNVALDTDDYANFYVMFRSMTDIAGIPYPSHQRRWEIPIDLYVKPFFHNELDYQDAIQEVAVMFETILGVPMFNLVDAPPEIGITVTYRNDITFDNYGVTRWGLGYYPAQATIEHRTGYSASTRDQLRYVAMHELGHAVGLNHSADTSHIMIGGQSPNGPWFSDDEIKVIRVFYTIPRGFAVRDFSQN